MPWFRRLGAVLTLVSPGFNSRLVCVGFLVVKVALVQIILQVDFTCHIIPPVLYNHLYLNAPLTRQTKGKDWNPSESMLLRKSGSFGYKSNSTSSLNHTFFSFCTSRLTDNSIKYTD